MKRVFALLPLCLLSGLAKAEEDHIGSVSEPFYQGAIGILPQSSGKEALNYSVRVYPKELVDASTGRTSLSFNDGTVLQVGAGSKVKLDEFIFDTSRCMFCALCQEACPTYCLELTQDFELATYSRAGFVWNREMLEQGRETVKYEA